VVKKAFRGSGSWWSKSPPSHRPLAGVRARSAAVGLKESPNNNGSSEESWTMNNRLI